LLHCKGHLRQCVTNATCVIQKALLLQKWSFIFIHEAESTTSRIQASPSSLGSFGAQCSQVFEMDWPVRHDQFLFPGLLAPRYIRSAQYSCALTPLSVVLSVSKSSWSKIVARPLPKFLQIDWAWSCDVWSMSKYTAWYRGGDIPSYKHKHDWKTKLFLLDFYILCFQLSVGSPMSI